MRVEKTQKIEETCCSAILEEKLGCSSLFLYVKLSFFLSNCFSFCFLTCFQCIFLILMDMIVSSCQNQTLRAKLYLENYGLRLLLVAIRINEKTDNTANRQLFLLRARGDKKALPPPLLFNFHIWSRYF